LDQEAQVNSSISVSKTTKRVLLAALFVVLVVELAIRFAVPFISGNAVHIKEIPQIARALRENQGIKILFLGNSMVNNGIEANIIKSEMERWGFVHTSITKINPDGTDLWDWYFLYKNHFFKNPIVPDIVAVGFGRDLLDDQRPANPSRLAGSFCRIQDLQDLIAFNLTDFSNIKEFLLASVSPLYANRETIRNRLFDVFMPFFREISVKIRASEWEKGTRAYTGHGKTITYTRLEKFLDMAKAKGSSVVLIAMPTLVKSPLRDELLMTAKKGSVSLIDLRDIRELSNTHFIDSVHLKPEGAAILSREIAKHLVPILSQQTGFSPTGLLIGSVGPQNGLRGDFN
jgi:hypothetical protein